MLPVSSSNVHSRAVIVRLMPLDGDKRHLVVEEPLSTSLVGKLVGRKHVRTNGQVVQQLC